MVGALVTNAALGDDARIRERWPLVAQAVLAGASPQLRNAATTGGNLLQRTRCPYFTDPTTPCNKRSPGEGCSARAGYHHIHAVLGWSDTCIATHPSDMAVALVAQDALVHVLGPRGPRSIPMAELHRLPGSAPERDTTLERTDLITGVELPPSGFGRQVHYLKVRERSSYAFATVSVAAALRLEAGRVADARVVLGGVAHRPWRSARAESALIGRSADRQAFRRAGEAAMSEARPLRDTAYKVPIARTAVARALELAAAGRPAFTVSS
jgi:xanthine dehydrogenase YagS FAD-binding subunit